MNTTTLTSLSATLVLAFCCGSSAHADTFGSGANTFDIDFVTVGDPGNAVDMTNARNPAGKVDYTYRMGTYEISEDMIDKANAHGSLSVTHNNLGANKPATRISWFEAAQFVNWLNTDSGSTPAYKFNGSTFELWTPGDEGYNPNNFYRNNQAKYFLPSYDEWHKAAYYDATRGLYYDYPTGSDSVPDGIDFAGDTTFDAVFPDGGFNPVPNDITDVGVLSPYGTAGQGGSVFEWEETATDRLNDSVSSYRVRRGGYWSSGNGSVPLRSSSWSGTIPSAERFESGFRVASIPEPSLPSDLTNNGFVDFEDLTILLANWNKEVTAAEGNLVNADTTPVNFDDLTVLLADWTGPGPAGSPEAALGAEAVPEP
ncbi:MAG: SUMF1/EgtB/PvdO family nonheme iron enzyme, partial [Planctomycetes bacterium]|nr:SUMF1/EgtB/PvdO family nonheme iron enzyme [Planctomycetota bacterium]